jgi:hypothetical protein
MSLDALISLSLADYESLKYFKEIERNVKNIH